MNPFITIHWINAINLVKLPVTVISNYRFRPIPIKIRELVESRSHIFTEYIEYIHRNGRLAH
jgi:hypothetical protein